MIACKQANISSGGIRGIVELVVLREIEIALGREIPLRAFFDLIVGTRSVLTLELVHLLLTIISTGGIIALAIGVKRWSLEKCIEQFTKLCNPAFTPRELHDLPALGRWAALNHGSKFKTTPLHQALKESLGEEFLFGGPREDDDNCDVNVAVTATDEKGSKAIVMANYSRSEHRPAHAQSDHEFIRPDHPSGEFRVWEAAAATSAAPTYFKPFKHGNGRSFLDGALYNNNPVNVAQRERKLLWPDVNDQHPDVLLSVGTGQDASQVELNDASKVRKR